MAKPRSHPQQYDLTTKELFKDIDRGLVRWLTGQEPQNMQWLDFAFPTIHEQKADLVFQADLETQSWIFHIELQTSNDNKIHHRMLRYWSQISEQYRLPVYQAVLYMGADALSMPCQLSFELAAENYLDYRFRLLALSQVTPEQLLALQETAFLALLPLSSMVQQRSQEELQACLDLLLKHTQNVEITQRRGLLLRTELLSGLRFGQAAIDAVFQEVEQMLAIEESAGYQRIYEKGLKKGQQEGRQEGHLEGRKEGQQEGIIRFQSKIIEILQKRFATLPIGVADAVRELKNFDQLDIALSNALEAKSLEVFLESLKS